MDQQIRDHLGNVNKVTQCKYSPDEVVKIGLGGAKLVNAKESISKIETFRYDKNFYKLSMSFTDSCSTTVIPTRLHQLARMCCTFVVEISGAFWITTALS